MVLICEQNCCCLDNIKVFSACHTVLPANRVRVHKKLRGDTSGTVDLNRPKGYPIMYDIILSKNSAGRRRKRDVWPYGVCLPK